MVFRAKHRRKYIVSFAKISNWGKIYRQQRLNLNMNQVSNLSSAWRTGDFSLSDWGSLQFNKFRTHLCHYNDVIMSAMASHVTRLAIVYSTVYSDTDERKHQSSVLLAFVRGIHGEFPAPKTSNAENVSIWWRHHDSCRFPNSTRCQAAGAILTTLSDTNLSYFRQSLISSHTLSVIKQH